MKLYYSPGACSMAPHIILKELGIESELESVDLKTHKTETGEDYYRVNPKGYVPALIRGEGDMLTEASAVLYYLSEQKPSPGVDRIKLIEWLTFLATEVHKNFAPLFSPSTAQETVKTCKNKLAQRFDLLDRELIQKPYLLGNEFTGADAYLYTMLNWCPKLGVDIGPFKNLEAFSKRVAKRPSVQEALEEEGLAK
jgi:glutathione S-transferase